MELHGVASAAPQTPKVEVTCPNQPGTSNPAQAIKALESALAQVPEGDTFAATRSTISAQIADLKKSITRSKPMGAQLDSCRAAIERAMKRKQCALEAAEKAHKDLQEAENQIEQLQEDLVQLEAQVASHHAQEHAHQNVAQVDSIQGTANALQKVLNEMQTSPTVPQESVAEAGLSMTSLMKGIQSIAVAAQQAATAQNQHQHQQLDFHDAAESIETGSTGFAPAPRRMAAKTGNGTVRSDPYTNPEVFQPVEGDVSPP